MSRYNPFMDRIKDGIREHKTTIIQVAVIIGIAIIVSAIMVTQLAPGKGEYTAAITALQGEDTRASASINTLGTTLTNRMDNLEDDTEAATSQIDTIGATTTLNSNDINALQARMGEAEDRITVVEANGSPPEGYLTGTVGNYTLHAKCSDAGNFTANVHLVFSPPISVGAAVTYNDAVTAFYASINWAAGSLRDYVCTVTYNGTAWHVNKASFNIGVFALEASVEKAVPILFGGLNSTYEPDYAYVEIWPALQGA